MDYTISLYLKNGDDTEMVLEDMCGVNKDVVMRIHESSDEYCLVPVEDITKFANKLHYVSGYEIPQFRVERAGDPNAPYSPEYAEKIKNDKIVMLEDVFPNGIPEYLDNYLLLM